MPMPPDVGAAIVAYLRCDRPVSSCRRLFIRALAPHVGFASGCAITMIAKMALKRAAIEAVALIKGHTSSATALLLSFSARVQSLSQIGQLLRHENHDTTRFYAKVDIAALRTLGLSGQEVAAMSTLRSALEQYLEYATGARYKYRYQARRLADFVSFMESRKAVTITTKLALAWATLPVGRHASWTLRLTDVRGFARHVAEHQSANGGAPVEILPSLKRARPYVYSDAEINALLTAVLALPPANALRRWTYYHLFGLVAVTGIRLSEAIGLHRSDVDLGEGVLTIRQE